MFVYPSIDVYSRAKEKTSLVITDPKLELYKSSKRTLEERGYDVYLLNLDDPLHSMGFNPLEQIKEEYLKKNYAEAELLAQSFSFSIFNPNSPTNTDAFWQDTASSDRLERIRTDGTEREVTFIFDSHDFKDYEYLSDWLHSQKASKGASTWGEALNSIVGTRTQIASIFRTCWG